jgi:hypothetical protein
MPEYFTTLNEIKDYLRIDRAETKHNIILNDLNVMTTEYIQNYIGRTIIQGTFTDVWNVDEDTPTLFFREFPVISIVAVTENSVLLTEGTNYETEMTTGLMTKKEASTQDIYRYQRIYRDYWYVGIETVTASYVAGITPIPSSIKMAAKKLVYREFYDRGVGDIKSRSDSGLSYTREDLTLGMPPGVLTYLQPYLRVEGRTNF